MNETLEDLPEKVRWANGHPERAEEMGRNAKQLLEDHVHLRGAQCYMYYLMLRIGELQDFVPRTFQYGVKA